MKSLVTILYAFQDLDGFRFIRRRNLYGLEAAFERAIFLDGLPKLRRSRRAYALDLATRKRRL